MADPRTDFRIRRHQKATSPGLDNSRADKILEGGIKILKDKDGPNDVSCSLDLRREGDVEVFSVGNGIIDSQADYYAVRGESTHPHRIYLVNQILYCGGNRPSPGYRYIGCADTPGSCMILVRIDEDEESLLWMHEFGHTKGLKHRNEEFALMNQTIGEDRLQLNQNESNNFKESSHLALEDQNRTAQPAMESMDDILHRTYIHGVPPEIEKKFSSKDVPKLIEILNNSNEQKKWPNIVTILGTIGDLQAVGPLTEFIIKGEGRLSRHAYDAKTVAITSIGRIINSYKSQSNKSELRFLLEGLDPEAWISKINWENPYNLNEEEQKVQLSRAAIWGLALTGTKIAEDSLNSFRANHHSFFEKDAERTKSTNTLIEEAVNFMKQRQ